MATKDSEISCGGGEMETVKKSRRPKTAKKYMGYVIVLATTAAAVLWFALFETVKPPLRMLCVVVIPELWVSCGSPRLMFLLSNVIIVILAIESGILGSDAPQNGGWDFYAEFIRKSSERRPDCCILDSTKPLKAAAAAARRRYGRSLSDKMTAPRARKFSDSDSTVGDTCQYKSKFGSSSRCSSAVYVGLGNNNNNESGIGGMSDEELKRRVEDFIANFNRQLRLQSQQSCGVR